MRRSIPQTTFALAALLSPALTFGALGGSASSIQADQARLKAQSRVARSAPRYTVQQIQTDYGTTVNEYVSANGTVFAVSWKGPVLPDLRQILGQYFTSYVEAGKSKHGGHSHLSIEQPGLVAHSSGHLRAFSGSAYIPGALPSGLTASDILLPEQT